MLKKFAVLLGLISLVSVQPLMAQNLSDFLKGKKKEQIFNVTIKCNPQADVYINGQNKGRANLTLSLKKGRYDLKLVPRRKKRFQELVTQIDVKSNQTFEFQLQKKNANLSDFLKGKFQSKVRINTNTRARVYINGEEKGIAPLEIKLKKGNYQLRLSPLEGGYEGLTTNIKVNEKQENFSFTLRQTMGSVRVNLPRGAALIINNQIKPYLPGQVLALPAGTVNIMVKYYALQVQQSLQIESGRTINLGLQLLLTGTN